jgi:hypothetical protein
MPTDVYIVRPDVNIVQFLGVNVGDAVRAHAHNVFETLQERVQQHVVIIVEYDAAAFVCNRLKPINHVDPEEYGVAARVDVRLHVFLDLNWLSRPENGPLVKSQHTW